MTEEEKQVAPCKELDDDFDQSEEKEKRQSWKTFDKYTSNFYKVRETKFDYLIEK